MRVFATPIVTGAAVGADRYALYSETTSASEAIQLTI
jgi:hypothetical protein